MKILVHNARKDGIVKENQEKKVWSNSIDQYYGGGIGFQSQYMQRSLTP